MSNSQPEVSQMRTVRFKQVLKGQTGSWHDGTLKDLVDAILIDYIADYFASEECVKLPALNELNNILLQGDGGMAIWKPFSITPEEYDELILEFLTEPGTDYKLIAEAAED